MEILCGDLENCKNHESLAQQIFSHLRYATSNKKECVYINNLSMNCCEHFLSNNVDGLG